MDMLIPAMSESHQGLMPNVRSFEGWESGVMAPAVAFLDAHAFAARLKGAWPLTLLIIHTPGGIPMDLYGYPPDPIMF